MGPASAQLFTACALARGGPLLVVTATGREADDLTAELRGVFGDAAAMFPSWETLPHERLSPGVDTVGARLMLLRRLAHPDDERLGPPLRVVVTTVRSLLQPMAPDIAEIEPVTLEPGAELDFDDLVARLVELAYSRVDMVGKRGEFAVRGGILDLFPPTAEHPVRVEFWGDEITEMRMFSVADQRSIPEIDVDAVVAVPCREFLLTDDARARAAKLLEDRPAVENRVGGSVGDMLAKTRRGHPRRRHGGAAAGVVAGGPHAADRSPARGHAAAGVRPGEGAHPRRRSDQDRTRVPRGVLVGGRDRWRRPDRRRTTRWLRLPRTRRRCVTAARAAGHPWWTLSQLGRGDRRSNSTCGRPRRRGDSRATSTRSSPCCGRTCATGGYAAVVAPGTGTAHRVVEQLAERDTPAAMLSSRRGAQGRCGRRAQGSAAHGIVVPGANLVVITETDLTGNRVTATDGRRLAAKRRNTVDPLALTAGDLVVHDQHGIGRFVEMVERTVGGARREYLVLEYGSSKRAGAGAKNTDKLFVPMDSLDQLSRYVGGQEPSLSRLGGSDWANTKTKARKAVREIASELVALYAKRQAAPGHAFGPDTPWQAEMEDAFGFTETVDQLTAITEVKTDMEKPVPMDRVICGDVGYGKTEIAVRAAFKAVQDGKQVAVLVPTTLLADQHLQTFTARMAGFPVTVKGLSQVH